RSGPLRPWPRLRASIWPPSGREQGRFLPACARPICPLHCRKLILGGSSPVPSTRWRKALPFPRCAATGRCCAARFRAGEPVAVGPICSPRYGSPNSALLFCSTAPVVLLHCRREFQMTASAEGRRPDTGWRTVFMEMLTGAREAAQRLPVTTLFLLAAALQANLVAADIHLFGEDSQGLPSDRNFEVGLGLVAGATASLAVTLRGEARKVSSAKTLPLALLAGIVACLVLALPDHFLTLEWAVMLGLVALVPIAPFIGRGDSSAFWIFAARSAFAVLLGVLALLLFAGGISAILASLTYLF